MASWITAHWMFPLQCEIVEVSSSSTSPLLRSACCNVWRPERLFSRSRKQEFGGRAEQSWVEEPEESEESGPLALWPAAWWTSAQGAASVKDEGKWVNIDPPVQPQQLLSFFQCGAVQDDVVLLVLWRLFNDTLESQRHSGTLTLVGQLLSVERSSSGGRTVW